MVDVADKNLISSQNTLKRLRAPLRRKQRWRRRCLPTLRSWKTLPAYLRDNEFIRTGYRAELSLLESLRSLFSVHNETGNVWSHLLGFLLFARLTLYVATMPPPPQSFDAFWTSVQELHVRIEGEVQSLQHSLVHHVEVLKAALEQSLVLLHNSLEEQGAAVKTRFEEKWHAAQFSLGAHVGQIRAHLYKSLQYLSDGINSIQENSKHVTHKAEGMQSMIHGCNYVGTTINWADSPGEEPSRTTGNIANVDSTDQSNGLRCAKEKLENNFAGLQDCLHHVQEEVSGNLHAVRGTLKEKLRLSFNGLQESLIHIQDLVGFQQSTSNKLELSSQCPVENYIYSLKEYSSARAVSRWPVYMFMAGAMTCMLISSVCHLLGCCGRHMSAVLWRFDYVGISLLIVTSFFPPVYYTFLCHPVWRGIYLAAISLLGTLTGLVCLAPSIKSRKYRGGRAKLFASLGLCGVVPLVHQCFINGHVDHVRSALVYMILMGATYLFGAMLFATRTPERYYPGAFDLLFNSHQLFHLAVVLGAFFHFQATMILLDWRESAGGCPGI